MLRFLGIATLLLVAVCLAIGASIALADTGPAPGIVSESRTIEAVDPEPAPAGSAMVGSIAQDRDDLPAQPWFDRS